MICIPRDINPGEYPLEELSDGWRNAKVTFFHRDPTKEKTTRYEIINIKTKERYIQEPMILISMKCFALAGFVLHVYFFFYGLLHLIRLPIVGIATCSFSVIIEEIATLARYPIYYIGMVLGAIYGILKPLDGRALFGEIESRLHDGKTRQDAETFFNKKTKISLKNSLWNFLTEKEHKTTFFIGSCMQPLGHTTDPHIDSFEIL